MEHHNDISYEVSEEFSRIYIVGPAKTLEKVSLEIGRTLAFPINNDKYKEMFEIVERYQEGKLNKSGFKESLGKYTETNFGGHQIMVSLDIAGTITGNENNVLLKYLYNGNNTYFTEVKNVFKIVLEKIV